MSDWMASISLKLNNDRTEILLVGHKSFFSDLCLDICDVQVRSSHAVCNVGVIFFFFFWRLTQAPIKHFIKISHLHLQTFICPSPSFKDAEIVIHAFLTSHLDYCNSLLTLLLIKLFKQVIFLNSAAHYTPIV